MQMNEEIINIHRGERFYWRFFSQCINIHISHSFRLSNTSVFILPFVISSHLFSTAHQHIEKLYSVTMCIHICLPINSSRCTFLSKEFQFLFLVAPIVSLFCSLKMQNRKEIEGKKWERNMFVSILILFASVRFSCECVTHVTVRGGLSLWFTSKTISCIWLNLPVVQFPSVANIFLRLAYQQNKTESSCRNPTFSATNC